MQAGPEPGPVDEAPGVPGEWGVDADPYTEDDSAGQGVEHEDGDDD